MAYCSVSRKSMVQYLYDDLRPLQISDLSNRIDNLLLLRPVKRIRESLRTVLDIARRESQDNLPEPLPKSAHRLPLSTR